MLFANNRGAGWNIGFPDVCLTPAAPAPLPIPYPNLAPNVMAFPFSFRVLITMMPGLNTGSSILMTTGDEGGVAHATFKGAGRYTIGNPFIFIDFLPVTHLCCLTTGNNMNNPIGAVLIPCITTVFFTCNVQGVKPGEITPEAMRQLDGVARGDDEDITAQLLDDEGTVLLRLRCVPRTAPTLVYRALRKLPEAKRLIVDMRGNPGGDAKAALSLADDFSPHGELLAELHHNDGDCESIRARGQAAYDMPMAVLIDGETASAAEVLAAALQSSGRALVVGQPSFGKSTVSKVFQDADRSTYAEVARYTAPGGKPIDGRGVTPDVHAGEQDDALALARRALLG